MAILLGGIAVAGCDDGLSPGPTTGANDENGPAPASKFGPAAGAPVRTEAQLFVDDFQGDTSQWTPYAGLWDIRDMAANSRQYLAPERTLNQTIAGNYRWTDYRVQARVTLREDAGKVGLLARVESDHHYYELLLGRDINDDKTGDGSAGARSWFIRKRVDHTWTTLASGPFPYEVDVPYLLQFNLQGSALEALISADSGQTFTRLGSTKDSTFAFGRIGLASFFARSSFDDVSVDGVTATTSALVNGPWGPIALLRDNTNRFTTEKPAGGWYVTPIHATLRANDGNVLLTGFGRIGLQNCNSESVRQVGETFVINPAQIDAIGDGTTIFVQPIDEQNLDPAHEVLYCAGHTTMADGRIYFSGGTRYPSTLPNTSPELGLAYSRVYNRSTGTLARVAAPTKGGQPQTPGMKWYPTSTLLPDNRILTFGGFHYYGGGPSGSAQKNQSLELFDPRIWDANPLADPYTVLTQHSEGNAETPPHRSYTNMFVLPRPVPAGSAGGFARTMTVSGNTGRVFLYNTEPGPTGSQRLFARPGAASINPASSIRGAGTATAMLPDGKIMYANGSEDGTGSSRAYFYDPYADSWGGALNLDNISRYYGDVLWLPNGTMLLINGYQNEPGPENIDSPNPAGASDGIRRAQIIDPFARTVSTLSPPWPEPVARGYHNIALLLKDGRILLGGGKDAAHNTGCEKNELRIYTPPYLTAGPRPTITNVSSGQTLTAGGGSLTINYTGTLRSTRGVALMAPGSMTHGFDQGQRYVPLTVTAGPSAGSVTVSLPATINETPPGDYLLYVVSNLGVPSVGIYVKVVGPAPCTYAVNGSGDSFIEAEGSSRRAAPFVQASDATRSGGAIMQTSTSAASTTTVPNEAQVLWYDIDVSNGGSFFVWMLANGPDTSSDTLYVSVDGNADQTITLPANVWGWVRGGTAINIPSGKHTLKVKHRERGAKIDKLRLTKSTSTTPPAGLGGTASSCLGTAITALSVKDTAAGTDGVANNTQWSTQLGFAGGGGQLAFGDRTYTIGALPAAATHFNGKPWIRTAAESRNYVAPGGTPPVIATANVYGSFVFIAIDSRHNSSPLSNAGYTNQGYALTVNEGATVRTYNVWRRAIPSGGVNVALPSLVSTTASFYFVIVE